MAQTISNLPVGATFVDPLTTCYGVPIVWRVLEHGHADDPAGTTTLESRDIIMLKCFDAKEPSNGNSYRKNYGNNRYLYSNLLQYLNSDAAEGAWYSAQHSADAPPSSANVWASSGTPINPYDTQAGFLSNFSPELKAALQTVTKITAKNTVTDGGSYENVSSKIFLLSNTEVGLANENSVAEGSIYAYYSQNNTNDRRKKYPTAEAISNNNYSNSNLSTSKPWYWWLRTPSASYSHGARFVDTDGTLSDHSAYSGNNGVAPAMAIPSSIMVSDQPNSDGHYEFVYPDYSIKDLYVGVNGVAKRVLAGYVGVDGEAQKIYEANETVDSSIYGAEWSGGSETTWTRTDAAAGFGNPSPAVSNGTGSSPFDEIYPWAGMQIVEDPTAGKVVEIPKFYYKWTRDGSKMKLQISNVQQDGFLCSPAHADRGDGAGERDYIYVGRYHCVTSTYKSTSGVTPQVNVTRANFRTSIHNLGAKYWQWDYATLWTIRMLYLVEFADWNSQAMIGYGCSDSGSVQNAGLTDSMQYHTGTNASSRTTYGHTQYRYIEDLWGNVYDWCDGIYFSGSNIYAIKNPANFSDSSGGTNVGTRATSSGYISGWTNPTASGFEYMLYPNAVSGGEATYISDYCYYNSSGVVLRVGGNYYQDQDHGLFYMYGNHSASYSNSGIGSRLLYLP